MQEAVALLGPNGAGKTTLVRTIMGLNKALEGKIQFNGHDITNLPTYIIVKYGLVMVPERRRLFPTMTVLENLLLGGYLIERKDILKERITKIFELFPILKERKKQLAGSLSGGEQQMLAIARGLILNPKMLILDEPSVGLAPKVVDKVYNVIAELKREGIAMLIVEQNVSKVLNVVSKIYIIQKGHIVAEVTSENLEKNPEIILNYLKFV
jgi:branched-chain amino acid transport system ATP-binding protein